MSVNKDRIWIVNSDLVGPKNRRNNPDGFHPMMRESWGALRDRLRAVLSRYYTVYRSTKGETLWNMANPGNANEGGANGVGRLADQAKDLVLSLGYDQSALSPELRLSSNTLTNGAWNAYTNRNPQSESWIFDDLDNFNNYIESLLLDQLNSWIEDYTSNHYVLSANSEIREASDVQCEIDSIYQYFVTSAPAYEEVISGAGYPEHLLPSAYLLQGEAFNTSSAPLTNYTIQAVSLDGHISWFDTSTQQETNEGVYYELYSQAAQEIISTGETTNVAENLKRLKNMVVLHSDLGGFTETSISLVPVPFYTKITLGKDNDNVSGKQSDIRIYEQIANDPSTKDFIDYAQLAAVQSYLNQTTGSNSFRTTQQQFQSPNNSNDFEFSTSTQQYSSVYKSSIIAPDILLSSAGRSDLETINDNSESTNAVLLRDFSRLEAGFEIDSTQINNAATATQGNLLTVTKNFSQVLLGTKAHSEVLMYVIEKRRIIDSAPGPLLQRFFVSPKFDTTDNRPIVFYDTQVKYGQRYVYNIHKIVTVFGNYYQYRNLQLEGAIEEGDIPDELPPAAAALPGLAEQLAAQEAAQEAAEELEETQDLFDLLTEVSERIADDVVNETLQDLLANQGVYTPFTPGTGPVSQGPGVFGRGPGAFGGPSQQRQLPQNTNLQAGLAFEIFDDFEDPES